VTHALPDQRLQGMRGIHAFERDLQRTLHLWKTTLLAPQHERDNLSNRQCRGRMSVPLNY